MSSISNLSKYKKIIISVQICGDEEGKALNKKYRGKNYPTDVLSFEANEEIGDGGFYLGDVAVNKDQAQRQAKDYSNSLEEEISELTAHGVLHLLGVHHKEGE